MTVRPDGLPVVMKALNQQEFRNFEWIIGTPFKKQIEKIVPDETIIIQDPPKPIDLYWQLNRQYNRCIEISKGNLILSIQDWIYFNPDTLSKFWYWFNNGYDKSLISGVGNKYKDDKWEEIVWKDPRIRTDQGSFYQCYWNDIEFNFCSIPREAFFVVGGFDEELDKVSGCDHISFQERLNDLGGWDFYLDQTQISKSIYHERLPNWEENNAKYGFYELRKEQLKKQNKYPVLDYLTI